MCNRKDFDSVDEIKDLIQAQIPDAEIFVQNRPEETHHLHLLIVSDAFIGKRTLQQHQMVMQSLKEKFAQDLHAIQLKTMTKEKYHQSA